MAHLRYIYVSKSIILCLWIIFVQITVTLMSSGSIQNPSYSPQHLQWECLIQASQLPMFNMQRIKSGQAMLWYYICNTFLSFLLGEWVFWGRQPSLQPFQQSIGTYCVILFYLCLVSYFLIIEHVCIRW